MSPGLIEGKDGWLFQTDERVFDWVMGKIQVTGEQVREWDKLHRDRMIHTQNYGEMYLSFIAPEKHVVYSGMLPEEYQVSRVRAANVIALGVLDVWYDPSILIRDGFLYRPTYSPGESHWNGFGAWSVACQIRHCFSLQADVEEPQFVECESERYNDLGRRIGKLYPTIIAKKRNATGRCVFDNMKFSYGNLKVFANSDRSLPTLVCFRDSFASNLLPLLAESFSRIVAVATWNYHRELVESERPDYVLHQVAERYVCSHPLTDDRAVPIQQLTGKTVEEIKQIGVADVPSEEPDFLY